MNAWTETLLENDADRREQLAAPCADCGKPVAGHYSRDRFDSRGRREWQPCAEHVARNSQRRTTA